MSERHHRHANGRSDPADLPAGELAEWWDRRTGRRRTRPALLETEPSETTRTAVAELEALSRGDELSAPRPGFLDHLERHLMDTPTAVLPAARPTPLEPTAPVVRLARPIRRSRGLIDILTLAAILALLLGGSWSVLTDRATAPPPEGPNGIAGVATSDEIGTPVADGGQVVALDLPWVENLPDVSINGVRPVNTSECVTPSREAGSVEAAVAEYLALGDAAPTLEPEFLVGPLIDPTAYEQGSPEDIEAATTLVQQLSACRFQTRESDEAPGSPFTGAYWNLLSADGLIPSPELLLGRSVETAVRSHFSVIASLQGGWSYPATVRDVRRVAPDSRGQPRLLITTIGLSATEFEQLSLLVREDGQWRFAHMTLNAPEPPYTRFTQVADIEVGGDAYGPRSAGYFSSRLEADYPVAMTIANVGETQQQVTIDGQDARIIEPGASQVFQPFEVRPESVVDAGHRLTFTVESVDLGVAVDASSPRPLTIAVYQAGSLGYGPTSDGQSTPAADPSPATTEPNPSAVLTSGATPAISPIASPVAPDRVVELEQPWAVSTGTEIFNGVDPVSIADCVTEPRASGALIELVENAAARPVAELPEYLTGTDLAALTARYPVATSADLSIAQDFLDQWSACRYGTGPIDAWLADRYTGPAWSLLSNDFLLRAIPEGEGRTAEALVRQFRPLFAQPAAGVYPDPVVDVRSFPSDALGQPRLLVVHRDLSPANWLQMSLLVMEDGTWRLAEYTATLGDAGPATPSADTPAGTDLIQIEVDVTNPLNNVLEGRVFAGIPVAMALHNGGAAPVPVRIGDQDLGSVEPGETVRIVPFIVPSAVDAGTGDAATVTITTTNGAGHELVTTWPVAPRD